MNNKKVIDNLPTNGMKLYMESAAIYMDIASKGKMLEKIEVHDDVMTVLGHPGKTIKKWAQEYFERH